jgi:hypothetical protein
MAASQARVCKGFIKKISGGALARTICSPDYCGVPATVWPKPDANAAIRPIQNHA